MTAEYFEPRLAFDTNVADIEPNDSFSAYQKLKDDSSYKITGTIAPDSGNEDFYGFTLKKGQSITWTISALDGDGGTQTYAALYSPSGELLQSDSMDGVDGPTHHGGKRTYEATVAGIYRIGVGSMTIFPDKTPSTRYQVTIDPTVDIKAKTLEWDVERKQLKFTYENSAKLSKASKGGLYWATGETVDTIIDKDKPAYSFNLGKNAGDQRPVSLAASRLNNGPENATHLILILDVSDKSKDGEIKETDENNNVLAVKSSWIMPTELKWNTKEGGLTFKYEVVGKANNAQTKAELLWATGPTLGDKPEGVAEPIDLDLSPGKHDSVRIEGSLLKSAPQGTTHLLLVIDKGTVNFDTRGKNLRAIEDVKVIPDPNAKDLHFETMSEKSAQAIKDSLRYAGQAVGYVTSAFRTTLEQAQAMINNYTFTQLHSLYGSNAAALTGIKAAEDALAANNLARKADPKIPKITKAELITAMTQAFDALPDKGAISKHLGNFAVLQAIDLSHSRMTNKKLFHEAVTANSKIGKVLDPYTTPKDKAFHVEIAQ